MKWDRYSYLRWLVPPLLLVLTSSTHTSSAVAAQEGQASPGMSELAPITARRLNRSEYNNTVRDLLGVTFRPADDFPQDDSSYGFDTIGDVLSLPPVLMEKYLTAAERITRMALYGADAMKPTSVRYYPYRYRPGEHPFLGKEGYSVTSYDLSGLTMPTSFHAVHRFPVEGEYLIRITGDGVRPAGSDPLQVGFWIDGALQSKTGELSNQAMEAGNILIEGQTAELRTTIPAGDRWIATSFLRQFEGLPAAYGGLNPSKNPVPEPPPRALPRPPANAIPEDLAAYERRKADASKPRMTRPDLYRARFIEIIGPYTQTRGPSPESLKKIFICDKREKGCDRKIVSHVARRAFRGSVAPEKIDRLMTLVSRSQKRGDPFEAGIGLAIQAMLVSPDFLFRIERNGSRPGTAANGTAYRIGDRELASRLSYFLWSSMPDDELLDAAERKTLNNPDVLAAQVRRMLQDPKSTALVQDFGGQWLHTRALESVKPDPIKFERWDEYLRLSMRRETELFFRHIITEDRSILDFLDADYTFLNDRLAHHYGIPGIQGPEFRKVALNGTSRGGILTHASVLTVSSYANRTSPVLRGKWVLENVLNTPPPDPPPNIPAIDETKTGTAASLRQQLEQHRENPSCRACHARMDPLGFGMENFDAVGAWRTQDGNFPIDATGTLPDGRSFEGPDQLKAVLKGDRARFAETMAHKMLLYALGRGLGPSDKPVVKGIADEVAANHYRFSSLVLGIVSSPPFQMRRGERVTP